MYKQLFIINIFTEWFEGYNNKPKNPFYATTTQSYGYDLNAMSLNSYSYIIHRATPPSVHTMPTAFFGKSQKFTGVSVTILIIITLLLTFNSIMESLECTEIIH